MDKDMDKFIDTVIKDRFINRIGKDDANLIMEFIFNELKQSLKENLIDRRTPLYIEEDFNSWVFDIEDDYTMYDRGRVVSIINRNGLEDSSFIVMRNEYDGVGGGDNITATKGAVFSISVDKHNRYLLSVLDHRYCNDYLLNRYNRDIIRPVKNYYPDMIRKTPISSIVISPDKEEYGYINAMFNKCYLKASELIKTTSKIRHDSAIKFIEGITHE